MSSGLSGVPAATKYRTDADYSDSVRRSLFVYPMGSQLRNLLAPQGNHRIYLTGTSRRYDTGQYGGTSEKDDDRREGRRIGRLHTEKLASQDTGHYQSTDETDCHARSAKFEALAQHELDNVRWAGAQRHSQTELVGSLAYSV